MAVPFKVKAIFEYTSPHEDDLTFPIGQIITVIEAEDDDWYTGEYTDAAGVKQEGLFPRNFVEKYEPDIPSRPVRPNRSKKETEAAPPPPPPAEVPTEPIVEDEPEPEPEEQVAPEPVKVASPVASPVVSPHVVEQRSVPAPAPAPASAPTPTRTTSSTSKRLSQLPVEPPVSSKPAPPPADGENPTVISFKDRIAAFNKASAAPIAPFKPASSNGFVKKPFVPPPPSRNAYVPPPREPVPKIYQREEDADLVQPPPPPPVVRSPEAETGGNEDQPKPTSLKDRIALLQRQQLEQAARHAEAAQKKEKPKRPPKKRIESQEQVDQTASQAPVVPELQRVNTTDTVGKTSVEFADDEGEEAPTTVQNPIGSPPLPARELTSDTNDADNDDTEDAGVSTGREDDDDKARTPAASSHPQREAAVAEQEEDDEEEEEEDEEEEEMDPEIKRRMELRERMAKMSGGMGMMGMFGPPGGMPKPSIPKKSKPSGESARTASGEQEYEQPVARAPPVPIMALPGMAMPGMAMPGMGRTKSSEIVESEQAVEKEVDTPTSAIPSTKARGPMEVPDIEDVEEADESETPEAASSPQVRSVPPALPTESKPPVPSTPADHTPISPESRHAPLPPTRPAAPMSPGELSDDELSESTAQEVSVPKKAERPVSIARQAPPPPTLPRRSTTQDSFDTPRSPVASSPMINEKRLSRPPPPLPPTAAPAAAPQTRAPPPPPPGPPSRKNTSELRTPAPKDDGSEEEVTEYDGDYDTDIASGVKHKDALKAHGREQSIDEDTIADEFAASSSPASAPIRGPPPLPPTNAPREAPPLPPVQAPKHTRHPSEMPRVPPPPPPPKELGQDDEEDEYDPFRYDSKPPPVPRTVPVPLPHATHAPAEEEEGDDYDDMYDATPITSRAPPPPPVDRVAPPPPPTERAAPPPPPSQAPSAPPPMGPPPTRKSMDLNRLQNHGRRSMDQSRSSIEHGFMASDIDLGLSTFWWTQPNSVPPSLQGRKDVLYEVESNSSSTGGKPTTTTEVYVVYLDYSQTTISITFDPSNPADYSVEQRHDRPPASPRQDQLEAASAEFGARISAAADAKQNTTVGNGTPSGLISDLISAFPNALKPIGTRSYGALVYANLANASTQQFDEIRAGDIVTFRNAKFQGHRGTMHQKYNIDLTKGGQDHVGIVVDWDGTKKKVRVWEQGRESKKVKVESFKLGDLRSGECRVWRVMGRKWVGWDNQS